VTGKVGAGQCMATIHGIDLGTDLHALSDSGGESSGVASRGLYDLLERPPRGRGRPRSWGVIRSGKALRRCQFY
jgi:hypothetical protein